MKETVYVITDNGVVSGELVTRVRDKVVVIDEGTPKLIGVFNCFSLKSRALQELARRNKAVAMKCMEIHYAALEEYEKAAAEEAAAKENQSKGDE